jgi:heme-degrading monooxygenase HmoA
MITRIVKLSLDPPKIKDFLVIFDQVKKDIRQFQGCNHLDLLGDITGSGIVFTYSLWETQENFLDYQNSALFKNTWAKVKPMFIAKAEAWSLEKLRESVVIG